MFRFIFVLIFVFHASIAISAETVVSAFRSICVDSFPTFAASEEKMAAFGAWADGVERYLPFTPHFAPRQVHRWQTGARDTKAMGDLLILRAEGTILDLPASGCLVGGHGVLSDAVVDGVLKSFLSAVLVDDWQPVRGDLGMQHAGATWLITIDGTEGLLTVMRMALDGWPGPGRTTLALQTFDARIRHKLSSPLR